MSMKSIARRIGHEVSECLRSSGSAHLANWHGVGPIQLNPRPRA